jgi:hypothetical protein
MGLSQADIQGRQAVAQEVQTLLRPHLPGTNYFRKSINLKTAYGACGLQQVGRPGQFGGQKSLGRLEKSREIADFVFCPHNKITSRLSHD